jgi:hypothetical protein
MQITVSFKLDLPEGGDINTAEELVIEASRRAMAGAIQDSVQAYEEQLKTCPHCGSEDVRNMGNGQRALLMSFGRVTLSTRRMRCHRCKYRFRPADGYLACLGETNITAALAQASILTGMLCSYDNAVKVLAKLCGVRMSAEQVRKLTQRAEMLENSHHLQV